VRFPVPLFLALRYLRPKRTFISVISVVSVLGVTLGIAVLILVISVMTGFDHELRRKVLGFDAHLSVDSSEGVLHDWEAAAKKLHNHPAVRGTAPFVQGPVLLATQIGMVRAVQIRGIDLELEKTVTGADYPLLDGERSLVGNSALIGKGMAMSLGLRVGDKIQVYPAKDLSGVLKALKDAETAPDSKAAIEQIRSMVLPESLTVKGIFETGRFQYDSDILLAPLHIAQELYNLSDGVHGIGVRLPDADSADLFKLPLVKHMGDTFRVFSWIDQNAEIFDSIAIERNTMMFLLMFIVVVAAFSIMNTLITVTVLKTREIGVLKAIGATRSQIILVFLLQGVIVGLFGNIAGLTLGMSLTHWRNEFKDWLSNQLGIPIFPPGVYQFSKIPAEFVTRDITLICISAFIICTIAALIPAAFAARMDPVKALRH
jgi:lipoprotein-releasing system permease protein